MRMIPCFSINFLNSSALCTDALSHSSSIRSAGKDGTAVAVCTTEYVELLRIKPIESMSTGILEHVDVTADPHL